MRKFFLAVAVWLVLIRIWLLSLVPNYLTSAKVDTLYKSPHYQAGLVLFVIFVVCWVIFRKISFLFLILVALSIALVLDQYTFIFEAMGVPLGIIYLSIIDTVVIGIFVVGLVFVGMSFKKKVKEKDEENEKDKR